MPFQRNPRRLRTTDPKGGLRVWGRTLLAVVALVVPTLTAIPASAAGSVTLTVVGGGTVTSTSNPSSCTSSSACNYSTPVTFSVTDAYKEVGGTWWKFAGWSAPCAGTGTCAFGADATSTYSVTATFVRVYQLSVSVQGSGRVSGLGISCSTGNSGTCVQYYDATFAQLSADVSADADTITVSATGSAPPTPFEVKLDSERMTVTGVSGPTWTVSRVAANRVAHSSGAVLYRYLALSTTAVPGYSFSTWTSATAPDCSGATCSPLMNANRVVEASFTCGISANGLVGAMQIPNPNPPLAGKPGFDALPDGSIARGCYVALPPLGAPNAVATPALNTAFPTDGSSVAVMTTGSASAAYTSNTNAGGLGGVGNSLGGPNVRGSFDLDVTVLRVDFSASQDACLAFDFQFLTEEFGDPITLSYNDAFIAELDTTDWYTAPEVVGGEPTDDADVIAEHNFAFSRNLAQMAYNDILNPPITSAGADISAAAAAGTTYDGATTLLQARKFVSRGPHALFLSIFDVGDRGLDSAVFIDGLTLEPPIGEGECGDPGATNRKFPLVVDVSPEGAGTVTARVGGTLDFSCDDSCGDYFLVADPPTVVDLEASLTSTDRYRFNGWSVCSPDSEGQPVCEASSGLTNSVTMSSWNFVTANFVRQYFLSLPSDSFEVTLLEGTGLNGGYWDEGSLVKIENRDSATVYGWRGCSWISSDGQFCYARMNQDRTIGAFTGSVTNNFILKIASAPADPTESGDRISYSVTVENTANGGQQKTPTLSVDFEFGLSTAPTIVSTGCALSSVVVGGVGDYTCQLAGISPGSTSAPFVVTIDAPLTGTAKPLIASFSVAGKTTNDGPTSETSSVSTLISARPEQDFNSDTVPTTGLSTFSAGTPVSDRNETGTTIEVKKIEGNGSRTSITGDKATIGEIEEPSPSAAVTASASATSTKKSGGGGSTTTSTQPGCDPTLPFTCWRFDLDAPDAKNIGASCASAPNAASPCYYVFRFVWDRTTFTDKDGLLLISLRKIYVYHRADGKTAYTKLGSCPSTGSITTACVKSIALQAATGDLEIVVWSPTNGQWKGGR